MVLASRYLLKKLDDGLQLRMLARKFAKLLQVARRVLGRKKRADIWSRWRF